MDQDWVTVPRRPTEAMLKAAGDYRNLAEHLWAAMIDAAPGGFNETSRRDPHKCWKCGEPLHPGHFCP